MSWHTYLAFFTGCIVGVLFGLAMPEVERPGHSVTPAYVTVEKAYQVDLLLPHGYDIAVDSEGGVTVYRLGGSDEQTED